MTEQSPYNLDSGPAPIETPAPAPPTFHQVRLVYKSGFVQDMVTDYFSVTRLPNGHLDVRWGDLCNPTPLLLGAHELAAVFDMGEVAAS